MPVMPVMPVHCALSALARFVATTPVVFPICARTPIAARLGAAMMLGGVATNVPAQEAGTPPAATDAAEAATVFVIGQKPPGKETRTPATVESVDAGSMAETINMMNTEDAVKYLPSLLVRKRYIGDTNAPLATRTTGINASARTLIFSDGLLLSTLVNNNNGNGSPQWFLVPPGAIDHIDVLYGPYSAAYAGNSYGAVVDITTRSPDRFEASAKASGSLQRYKAYGHGDTDGAYEFTGGIGDRAGAFSWRLGVEHLVSDSQPLTFGTLSQSTTIAGESSQPLAGSHADRNRSGAPIVVIGEGSITHTKQDSVTLKLGYDLTSTIKAGYTIGYWQNDAQTHPYSDLRDAGGKPYFGAGSGSVDIGGFQYNASAIAGQFSEGRADQEHLAQAVSLRQAGSDWDWQVIASDFDYLKDIARQSTAVFVDGRAVGAGRITDAGDTGWRTLDAVASWHAQGIAHLLSFGAHGDRYELGSPVYDTSDWRGGGKGALFSSSEGKTQTTALWAQDQWRFVPAWTLTLGGRYEWWKAYDGFNSNRTGSAPDFSYAEVDQPRIRKSGFSPKATLAWQATPGWQFKASFGRALRFPTVGELYQNISTGSTYTQADPNLKPEDVRSEEVSAVYTDSQTDLRLTLFQENVSDALISQTSLIDATHTTPVSFVQNVGETRQRGFELAADRRDALIKGLELSGSVTYVDAEIIENDSYVPPPSTPDATSVGKRTPYVAKWRASLVSVYRPDDRWAFTLAGRYSSPLYATVDNTDINPHTYQGFEGFFVADARVHYRIDAHWGAALGIDNLNNRDYYLFHPFPQRTAYAEIGYDF
jgi:iron complex outermembrane receptor protein